MLELVPASNFRPHVPAGTSEVLVCHESGWAYPVTEGIARFLDYDAIRLDGHSPNHVSESTDKKSVREWYDNYGWQKNADGVYFDTTSFSQVSRMGHGLYETLSHLTILSELNAGDFLLDAASGAIAHPEYLTYSWPHRYRVCVDMSIMALQEAKTKLGNTGYAVHADICQLPFTANAFAGAVSGYTINHIPRNEQQRAVAELFRVIAPGTNLCVMTDTSLSRSHDYVVSVTQRICRILRALRIYHPRSASTSKPITPAPPHELYNHPRDVAWWKTVARDLGAQITIESLRLFHRTEFLRLFGDSSTAARRILALQSLFPRLLSRPSYYVTIVLRKRT